MSPASSAGTSWPLRRSPGRRRTAGRFSRGLRLALLVAAGGVALSGCDYKRAVALGIPRPITDQGHSIEALWAGSVIAALAVGGFVWALMFFAMFAYRKRSDDLPRQVRYNLPIEALYTVVPFVIIAVLFYYTAVKETYIDKLSANPDVRIGVVGFQWSWQFNYVGEGVQVTGTPAQPPTLVIPTNQTIRFIETSPDVIHSFWVPEFLFKRDVIPGRVNQFEVTVRKEGTYTGRCAELCGTDHDRMYFAVRVVNGAEYRRYLADMKARQAQPAQPPSVTGPTAAGPTAAGPAGPTAAASPSPAP